MIEFPRVSPLCLLHLHKIQPSSRSQPKNGRDRIKIPCRRQCPVKKEVNWSVHALQTVQFSSFEYSIVKQYKKNENYVDWIQKKRQRQREFSVHSFYTKTVQVYWFLSDAEMWLFCGHIWSLSDCGTCTNMNECGTCHSSRALWACGITQWLAAQNLNCLAFS